ncbi:hypothetical protein [Neisseria sp. 83E34]|uniref:hypothetical protein n=1 Tax=Neisseria sp. 83E34 TaxID=1692264 RepID=UPI0006CE8006|nr:hypothetical protein [Neisseria sp. 83E34]KPN72395.1 hypothetical protein AKG09_00630 [Neisseria sp. 83E34]
MRKLLTFFFGDPKEVILQSKHDIQKHAGKLSRLSEEEREILTDYLSYTEMNERLPNSEKNPNYHYGISVGQAIEKQKYHMN